MTVNAWVNGSCSTCNSAKFAVVKRNTVEIMTEARSRHNARANWLHCPFDIVVCLGCGLTRFFMKLDEENLFERFEHEVVDTSAGTPYR